MTERQKEENFWIGVGVVAGVTAVAVITAPIWLPPAKTRAVQVVGCKCLGIATKAFLKA